RGDPRGRSNNREATITPWSAATRVAEATIGKPLSPIEFEDCDHDDIILLALSHIYTYIYGRRRANLPVAAASQQQHEASCGKPARHKRWQVDARPDGGEPATARGQLRQADATLGGGKPATA
ncbi:MAG: hypothetical protein ACKPKO_10285, partial [Candidatus Fonsibacter sp.]